MHSLNVDKSKRVSVCPSPWRLHVHALTFWETWAPPAGYLTNCGSRVLTYSLTLSLHTQPTTTNPLPPSTRACWREPCNNPPCFHDNHLLLSSPHLSPAPSLPQLRPSLPPSPLFLPLSFLPFFHTLLVFQGQRGSQPDSEIETEIRFESGERRAIAMGETTDKGWLEDRNLPDVVIVSTLDLGQ